MASAAYRSGERLTVSVVWWAPCGSADGDEDEGPRRHDRALLLCVHIVVRPVRTRRLPPARGDHRVGRRRRHTTSGIAPDTVPRALQVSPEFARVPLVPPDRRRGPAIVNGITRS